MDSVEIPNPLFIHLDDLKKTQNENHIQVSEGLNRKYWPMS